MLLRDKIIERRQNRVSIAFWKMTEQLQYLAEIERFEKERKKFRKIDELSAAMMDFRKRELDAKRLMEEKILRCQERVRKQEKDALELRRKLEERKREQTQRIAEEKRAQK